jgi:hypothetical protein
MRKLIVGVALAALICSVPASAQVMLPRVHDASGASVPSNGTVAVDSSGTELSDPATHTLSVAGSVGLATIAPTTWAVPATAIDLRAYPSAEVQFAGISGGDSFACSRSLDATNYVALTAIYDVNGVGPVATITADGIYSPRGGGYLKCVKTGSASTVTVTYRGGQ